MRRETCESIWTAAKKQLFTVPCSDRKQLRNRRKQSPTTSRKFSLMTLYIRSRNAVPTQYMRIVQCPLLCPAAELQMPMRYQNPVKCSRSPPNSSANAFIHHDKVLHSKSRTTLLQRPNKRLNLGQQLRNTKWLAHNLIHPGVLRNRDLFHARVGRDRDDGYMT
jgi:hypothetical protein